MQVGTYKSQGAPRITSPPPEAVGEERPGTGFPPALGRSQPLILAFAFQGWETVSSPAEPLQFPVLCYGSRSQQMHSALCGAPALFGPILVRERGLLYAHQWMASRSPPAAQGGLRVSGMWIWPRGGVSAGTGVPGSGLLFIPLDSPALHFCFIAVRVFSLLPPGPGLLSPSGKTGRGRGLSLVC